MQKKRDKNNNNCNSCDVYTPRQSGQNQIISNYIMEFSWNVNLFPRFPYAPHIIHTIQFQFTVFSKPQIIIRHIGLFPYTLTFQMDRDRDGTTTKK